MNRLLIALGATSLLIGCLNFDTAREECRTEGRCERSTGGGVTGGGVTGGGVTGGGATSGGGGGATGGGTIGGGGGTTGGGGGTTGGGGGTTGGGGGTTGGGGGTGGGGTTGGGGGSSMTLTDGGACNPQAAGGATRDSDCDGITDANELAFTWAGGLKTNPCNPDTDGDGLPDGLEASLNAATAMCAGLTRTDADVQSHTNPTVADTDGDTLGDGAEDVNGDGRVDASETSPTMADTDCDGLSDSIEGVGSCATNPLSNDTDNDGLYDGVERGVTGANYAGCNYSALMGLFDQDPATSTSACNPDFDNDSILDGDEDLNANGKLDPGERDPRMADAVFYSGACASDGGTRMDVRRVPESDLAVAIPPDFAEVVPVRTTGTYQAGFLFQSSMRATAAGVVVKQTGAGGGAPSAIESDEPGYRGQLLGAPVGGGVGTLEPLAFEKGLSWDGYPTLTAHYRMSNNTNHIAAANAVANALLGGGTTGQLAAQSADAGVLRVDVAWVKRSKVATVVVFAISSETAPASTELLRMAVARSTTVGQYKDAVRRPCASFTRGPAPGLDWVWVVDDSPLPSTNGMGPVQQNLATTLQSIVAPAFVNGDVSGRISMTTTSSYSGGNIDTRAWTPATTNVAQWLSSAVDGGTPIGIDGLDTERGFDALLLSPGQFRPDAAVQVFLATDAPDQSTATWNNFLGPSFTQPAFIGGATLSPMLHAISCPEGLNCNDGLEANPGKIASTVRVSGGSLGDVQYFRGTNTSVQTAVMQRITNRVINSVGYAVPVQDMPASMRVSTQAILPDGGGPNCAAVVPQSRASGWDVDVYDTAARISFFGTCRASYGAVAVQATVFDDRSPAPAQECAQWCGLSGYCDAGACACNGTCGNGCPSGLACNTSKCTCEALVDAGP